MPIIDIVEDFVFDQYGATSETPVRNWHCGQPNISTDLLQPWMAAGDLDHQLWVVQDGISLLIGLLLGA